MPVTHTFVNPLADEPGFLGTKPSDWNANHIASIDNADVVPNAGIEESKLALNFPTHAPVTLGTANGLVLAGQALSMNLAGANSTGTLSAQDWNTFNSKQSSLSFPLDASLGGTSVNNSGTFTNHSNITIMGGGIISLDGFTLTIPATGIAALLGTANVFTADQRINAKLGVGVAPSAVSQLNISQTVSTDVVGAASISNVTIDAGATATTNGIYAHFVQAEVAAGQSGNVSALTGIVGVLNNLGTGNVTNAIGMEFSVGNLGTGFIFTGVALSIGTAVNSGGGFFANTIGIRVGDQSVGWMSNTAIQTGKGLVNLGDAVTIMGWQDTSQLVVIGFTTQTNPVAHLIDNTGTTNAVRNILKIESRSTGTVAAGFGVGLPYYAETATGGTYQQQGLISTSWIDATNASRKAKMSLSAYDTAARVGIEIEASGTAVKLGFYGVATVARATNAIAAGAFVANTSGIADDTATFGGYTIGQIAQALINIGILT